MRVFPPITTHTEDGIPENLAIRDALIDVAIL